MNTVKVRNLELGNGIPAICIPNVGKTKEDILSLTRTYLDMHMDLMEWRMDWYEDVEDIAKVTELVKELRDVMGNTPLLCTFRTDKEGGVHPMPTEKYAELNKAVAATGNAEDHPMTGINGGSTVTTGFAHNAVLSNAGHIVELIKAGKIRHIFLVGGCDGAAPGRSYYTDFAKAAPMDTLILTLACGKYRLNDLDLGSIDGIPRILDMGQCNDAYSAIKVALTLAEVFDCTVNDLPLTLVLSWYEQKAVCILLTLLSLGVKNILLGPTLPAFVSENVWKILVENYNIQKISTVEEDMKKILG